MFRSGGEVVSESVGQVANSVTVVLGNVMSVLDYFIDTPMPIL